MLSPLPVNTPRRGARRQPKVRIWSIFTPNDHTFILNALPLPNFIPFYTEFYSEHKNLPTVEELINVWDVCLAEEPSEPGPELNLFKRQIAVLTWYLDVYMPNIALPIWWGPTIRPYKLMTDSLDVLGVKKVHVTATTEAFGLLQFENSREKWIEIFKWKKIHGWKKTAPQHCKARHEETKKFRAKWSEHKTGQGSGWDPVAYNTFNQRIQQIQEFRAKDKEDNYKRMKFGQELVRKVHEVEVGATEHTNKRRRTGTVQEVDVSAGPVIMLLDE